MDQNKNRDFKGVWIDKEIWEDKNLTALDKVIFTEINSLDNTEEGCTASNKYLSDFCQCTETKVSMAVKKLIDLGYLTVVKFDGRRRYLKSNYRFQRIRLTKNERQPLKNLKADFKKVNAINIDNNIYIYMNEYIEKEFERPLTPNEYAKVETWLKIYDEELIKGAVCIAIVNRKLNINYINAILMNWKNDGYEKIDDLPEEYIKRIKLKSLMYDSTNKIEDYSGELFDYNIIENE